MSPSTVAAPLSCRWKAKERKPFLLTPSLRKESGAALAASLFVLLVLFGLDGAILPLLWVDVVDGDGSPLGGRLYV